MDEILSGKTFRWESFNSIKQKIYDIIETPFTNPDGNISVLGILRDITELKNAQKKIIASKNLLALKVEIATRELSEEKHKFETVIETYPNAILVLDSKGFLYLSNKSFIDLYQIIYQEKFPEKFNIFYQYEKFLLNEIKIMISKRMNGKVEQETINNTLEPIPGLFIDIGITNIAFTDSGNSNAELGFIIELRDVSKSVEYDNLRKQFISTVSHELRTPISVIVQSISNILNYKDKLTQEQFDRIYKAIDTNSILMAELIEDLLCVSRIEEKSLKVDWKKYYILTAVNNAIIQLEPKRKDKNVNIEIEGAKSISLFGDIRRIEQICRIFIDNAIKYSKEQSKLVIKIIDSYTGNFNSENVDGVLIQFIDFGKGIKKKDIDKIFDRFYRSEDVHSITGTGLGLSIAKDLTSYHGGKVFVESKFNVGSTFSVFLPRLKEK